ncbi:MAG: hypothetical protein FWD78_02205 [Treponema sp.]|nr:hypothetical protein [Treponema sp.]
MKTLAARLLDVRTRTGGTREKSRFEWSFGTPLETLHHIALPNQKIIRILSELEFAIKLSLANSGKFDSEIGKALEVLEKSLAKQGVLTADACAESENFLLPLKNSAKEYTVLCASHAHIDMNWMWGWQETVAASLATFRTILGLMNEYPDFTFSQSQASVYSIVEKYDPEMKEEITRRIKEGRWEVTASAWVETDKNMPCAESLLRHIRYTKDYLCANWGVDPDTLNIDFSPDTFGHSANIPEIDSYGGVKFMYHCRALSERYVLYRWQSPSGSEILSYCEPFWYNSGITAEIGCGVTELESLCGGLKTSLIVYGVGDHGGGPTRRDIEQIIEIGGWPVFPKVKFGTLHEYFNAAQAVRDKVPLINKEINYMFTGCYTTQSRIKLGNRKGEAALLDAEALDASAGLLTGKTYSKEKYTESWRDLLFTHFHDILTGSCVRDSREYAMGLFAKIMALGQTMREKASLNIAAQIDTSNLLIPGADAAAEGTAESDPKGTRSEGAGTGFGIANYSGVPSPERGRGPARIFHIFNPLPITRKETVEFTVWDWNYDMDRIEMTYAPDSNQNPGSKLPFQTLDKEPQRYWDHWFFKLIAPVEIPASGYTTVVLKEAEMGKNYPFYFQPFPRTEPVHGPVILENEFIKAVFDPQTGALSSLTDKRGEKENGAEKLARGQKARLILNWAEKTTNNAWNIGRFLASDPVTKTTKITVSTGNTLRNFLEIEQQILNSKIKTTVFLDKDSRSLSYSFNIEWNEIASLYDKVPVLCFSVPLAVKPDYYQYDIPGGFLKTAGDFQDFPANQYAAAVNGQKAVALVTDCKYGFRGCEDVLSVTLINTASSPDPYPERGEHAIKLWINNGSGDPKTLYDTAVSLCRPVNIISGTKHQGNLPLKKEMLKLEAKSSVVNSQAMIDQNTLLIRGYETSGVKDKVRLTMPCRVKEAHFVDLDLKIMDAKKDGCGNITVNSNENLVEFDALPNKIFGLLVKI